MPMENRRRSPAGGTLALRKSMTIIGLMGAIAMVLLSMLGASFLGRVGDIEGLPRLRERLLLRHSGIVEDADSFKLRPLHVGEGEGKRRGLLIRFTPTEEVAGDRERLEKTCRRMAGHVYADPDWARKLDFVEVAARVGEQEVRHRFSEEEARTRYGNRRG
jgi:hypothetical protein